MNQKELERLFVETLDDHHFSRGERRALSELLRELDPPADERLGLIGRAFRLARDELHDRRDAEVLDWLEGLVRTLFPRRIPRRGEAVFSPHQDCAARLVELLDAARSSAEICVFTITDNRLAKAILRAHGRGVAVRIISDDEKALDRGSDVFRLQEAGVAVRMDRSEDHMHHKFALFDRRLLANGSYNWTRSASERNRENISITDDARLVAAFGEEFDLLWETFEPQHSGSSSAFVT